MLSDLWPLPDARALCPAATSLPRRCVCPAYRAARLGGRSYLDARAAGRGPWAGGWAAGARFGGCAWGCRGALGAGGGAASGRGVPTAGRRAAAERRGGPRLESSILPVVRSIWLAEFSVELSSYLLGLLAKIKCSICSYQLNLWYLLHGNK